MTNPYNLREEIANLLQMTKEDRENLHKISITTLIQGLILYATKLEEETKKLHEMKHSKMKLTPKQKQLKNKIERGEYFKVEVKDVQQFITDLEYAYNIINERLDFTNKLQPQEILKREIV